MWLKTAIFCSSVLTSSFFAPTAFANLEDGEWIYHDVLEDHRFSVVTVRQGSPMLPLADVARAFKLKIHYDPKLFRITLQNPAKKRQISFHTYSRVVNGPWGSSELSRAPAFDGARLLLPLDFADRALRPLLSGEKPSPTPSPADFARRNPNLQVLLDPGHGGNDHGAHGHMGRDNALREKDMSLTLAKELRTQLQKRGIRAALTRENDSYLSLHERTQLANAAQAQLFLSLHLNADPTGKGQGYELYVLSLNDANEEGRAAVAGENQMIPEELPAGVDRAIADLRASDNLQLSLAWAKALTPALTKQLQPYGKAVKAAPFYVLYGATMPALLLEFGFITHPRDRGVLLSHHQRGQLLGRLADAISAKFSQQKASTPPPPQPK